ncbi:MAG: hypothetical protein NVSMB9_06690 [Isosphaeraceae bacterium]
MKNGFLPSDGSEGSPPWGLAILFAVEVIVLMAFQSPLERYSRFAYCDSGSDLTIQALLARGLRPTIDFGYIYGLLPLSINGFWQGLFGATPIACRGAALICNFGLAWGLARFVSALRVGPAGIALIVLAMPDMLLTSIVVLVHVLEHTLLVNALAFQARGRRGLALALATVCLFVKPSMAYLYGLILLMSAWRAGDLARKRWRITLAPAVVTALFLSAFLIAIHGGRPLLTTLLPGNGMEVYRQSHHGFFRGIGRDFWVIPNGGLRDYLRYEVGSWIAGTFVLGAGGILSVLRIIQRRATRIDEIVSTCALLHFGFVTLFFGNRWSWAYYYAILILGLAAMAARGGRNAGIVGALAMLVLIGGKAKFETTARLWSTDRPDAETFGLWAGPAERAEWHKVLEIAKGKHPVVLLAVVEGAAFLRPDVFEPPVGSYFVRGHTVPSEIRRKADLVAGASLIVTARPPGDPGHGGYDQWPEIADALDGCEVVFEGNGLKVERRVRPPASRGSQHFGGDVSRPRRSNQ